MPLGKYLTPNKTNTKSLIFLYLKTTFLYLKTTFLYLKTTFLYLKTTPIVEELIGAADACQGDSGGPMVTHEGIFFFMKVGL